MSTTQFPASALEMQMMHEDSENNELQEVIRSMRPFQLDNLDDEWVSNIFQSEFLDTCELPPEYEAQFCAEDTVQTLRKAGRALDNWKENSSWAILSQELKYRPLLALLYHLMDYGNRNLYTQEYRNNAVLSAQLYCKLLAIPGFKAYSVYHSQLFVACLSCLGFPKTLCDNEENRLSAAQRAREVNSYNAKLRSFLKDLKIVVKLLELKPEEVAFEELLNHLIDLTGMVVIDKINLDRLELNIISQVSYEIIHTLLIGNDDEPQSKNIQALFKGLLPKLVATSMDCRASASVSRAAHVTYCAVLIARYGKAALFGYNILLQHLCYTLDGVERAEIRTSRVALVVGLMSLLPKKAFNKFVDWVLKLSTTAKAPHRVLALEIFAKLLNTTEDDDKDQQSTAAEQKTQQTVDISVSEQPAADKQTDELTDHSAVDKTLENKQTVDQPMDDQSSSQAEISNTEQPSSEGPTTEHVTPDEEVPPGASDTTTEVKSPSDFADDNSQSSQDSQGTQVEEDGAPVITEQTHTVPYVKILQATFERANDVSSTVRVRALAILMSCITSDQSALRRAVKKLNGTGEQPQLMSLAVRYMGDERAVVRKSAITLVDVQLQRDETLLTKKNLGVLVSLCRDTSVLVRSTAVATLGDLMTRWPRDCTFDAFLAGPMRQLKDPETKVQEQIQEIVKNTVIVRLMPHSAHAAPGQRLPWLLLDAVARHNMRRHLEKVCGMLSRTSKCINHRLIDTISTHLGRDTDNDLNCMILLSSVARHVDYSNVDFLLAYYYDLANNLQARDARLQPLLLEVLTDWSRYLAPEQRAALRSHLIECLHNGTCRSEGSRRWSAMLAAHLEPADVSWATELLAACERRALEGAPVAEWVCAADLSLVAPRPPEPRLVRLYIDTAAEFATPHPELSPAAQGCVVAALGRVCVRARGAAAAAAPALAALLVAPQAPVCVRVNCLLALSDMCKRYTGVVEPQLGAMCACLGSAPPALRRAAARAVTRLLLNDFLKLRPPLYYRYCALLADADVEVREPAEYYVASVLSADAIYRHFVECVLYYNGCSGHSVHDADRDDSAHVDLPGHSSDSLKFEARQQIYDMMLQRMTPGQRMAVQCRLASEVLVHAAALSDEESALSAGLRAAVQDTVAVLCGPQMRLPRKPPQTETAMNVEDLTARVTSNIVSQKMKKTVAEVLVPAVIRLYAGLTAAAASRRTVTNNATTTATATTTPATDGTGDELATCLVRLASDLLKDYRLEIEELIDNDPELVEQISRFQEKIGEEPSFRHKHNIVLRDEPDVDATPLVKLKARTRRTPLSRLPQPPSKRALRL